VAPPEPAPPPAATTPPAPDPAAAAAADPAAIMRSRGYVVLLLFGALVGAPVSAIAFGFLELVSVLQRALYDHLPNGLGFHGTPVWWPVPMLVAGGLVVAAAIRYLPGRGGHSPADGFSAAMTEPISLPGVAIAAIATLACGAVLGPEAPLIALGSGFALFAVRRIRPGAPASAQLVVAGAGSFAAIATILGSPLLAAIFMIEGVGLGGALLSAMLLPGLLAAGVGALVFIGLGHWSGVGTFSLVIPNLPTVVRPTAAEFGWAIAIGLAAAGLAIVIRRGAVWMKGVTEARLFLVVPLVGLAVAGLAIGFAEATGKPSSSVLFSGQTLIGTVLVHSAAWSLGALLLLLLCKGLGYLLCLGSFRGGPIFPSLLLGAVGGLAASHLPDLPFVPAAAMGMGALCAAMLRLPVVSVALPCVLLFHDGVALAPIVIVAVVVSFVTINWLDPKPPAQQLAVAGSPPGGTASSD
jgi:chloride channel protein, CIC family